MGIDICTRCDSMFDEDCHADFYRAEYDNEAICDSCYDEMVLPEDMPEKEIDD